MRRATVGASLVFFAAMACSARAQSITPCNGLVRGNAPHDIFMQSPNGEGGDLVFTATLRTTFEQKLADGSIVQASHEGIEARDMDGRVARRNPSGCFTDATGKQTLQLNMSVVDRKAKTFESWETGPETASVVILRHMAPMAGAGNAAAVNTGGGMPAEMMPRTSQPEFRHEELGTENIAGFSAKGERVTETIPAGRAGNSEPIYVVHEMWVAPEQHLLLKLVDDDPRKGKVTWEVTSFNKSVPDAALFAPPANYEVREIPTQTAAARPGAVQR